MQLWGKTEKGAKEISQGVDVSRETVSGTCETYMVEMEFTATTDSYWFHVMSTMSITLFRLQVLAPKARCVLHRGSEIRLLHRRLNTSQGYPGYSFL